jgi:hypothetical protein
MAEYERVQKAEKWKTRNGGSGLEMFYKTSVKIFDTALTPQKNKDVNAAPKNLTLKFHNNVLVKDVEDGLEYILTHFIGRVWPRTISTKTTNRRQILIYNQEEALARFKQANWQDCRISACPSFTEYKGINRQAPNFIFIDLDRSTFRTEAAHVRAVAKTLENIRQRLGGNPTVLWSGNGYHVYLPVAAFVLEEEQVFAKFQSLKPSRSFMQFAESFLSGNKADHAHNLTVSFKNCMLRVPGSINSKNGQAVRLLNIWDGYRPKIKSLLEDFYIYLTSLRIKELTKQKQTDTKRESYYQSISRYLRLKGQRR